MGAFALAGLAVRFSFWLIAMTFRVAGRTGVFAWRRPKTFLVCLAALPVLLALPEYLS